MAGFQLAGPAADVSKSLYGENRKSYQSPNAQYTFDHFEGSRSCQVLKIASSGRGEHIPQRFAVVSLLYMTVDRWFNAHRNAQHLALYPSKMVTKS